MAHLLLDLKPNEFAAIVFGIVGMVFGLIAFQRAGRSERMALEGVNRALEIAYAQRKDEVLSSITAGRVAYLAVIRKLVGFEDAALEANAAEVGPFAEKLKKGASAAIEKLDELERLIVDTDARGKSHEDLMLLMDRHKVAIKKLADPALIAE